MRCWNCGKKIPRKAKICQFCEVAVDTAPTEEEKEAVRGLLQQMPPEAIDEIAEAFEDSETAEEFVNRIFVGECPSCGSKETGDCENDPDIDNLLVGRCYQCGQSWCTECLRLLDRARPECPCWDEE